jgi:addiction module HigA family antidote
MIEENRSEFQPDMVLPPGDTLLEMLLERNMTQTELSYRTGRPLKTINEIIKGKAAITPETAIQLEIVFGISADFWNQLELNYRSFLARIKADQKLIEHEDWFKKSKFPIKEMIALGWIPDVGKNVLLRIRELLSFYSVVSQNEWEKIWLKTQLAFRRSGKFNTHAGPTSAWLRQGEIEANEIECNDFDMNILNESLEKLRKLTVESDPKKFIPEVVRICAQAGVTVVFLPTVKGAPISGVSRWLHAKKAMIVLSLRHKTDDHLWFTLFHELGHIILHNKKEMLVDFSENVINKPSEEIEADNFASEILIPNDKLCAWLKENSVSECTIRLFS